MMETVALYALFLLISVGCLSLAVLIILRTINIAKDILTDMWG